MRSLNDYMFSESVEMQLLKKENNYQFSCCVFYTIRDQKNIVKLVEWLEKHQRYITVQSCGGEMCITIESMFFCNSFMFFIKNLACISVSLSFNDKIHLIFKSPYATNEDVLC